MELLSTLSLAVASLIIIGGVAGALHRYKTMPDASVVVTVLCAGPAAALLLMPFQPLPSWTTLTFTGIFLGVLIRMRFVRWSRPTLNSLLLIAAFVAWCAVTLTYSPVPDYGVEKLTNFLARAVVPGLALGIAALPRYSGVSVRWLGWRSGAILCAATFIGLVFWGNGSAFPGRVVFGGFNPIWLARDVVMIIAFVVVTSKARLGAKFLVVLIGGIDLLIIGARGPVVAFLLAWGILALAGAVRARYRSYLWVAIGAVVVMPVVVAQFQSSWDAFSIERYAALVNDGPDRNTEVRINAFGEALNFSDGQLLFGSGLGGFAEREPVLRYPHNVVAELIYEVGLIGFGLWLVMAAIMAVKASRVGLSLPFYSGLLFAMVSGDLGGNRWYWIVGIAAIVRAGQHVPGSSSPAREKHRTKSTLPALT